jgi:hypothetical protein
VSSLLSFCSGARQRHWGPLTPPVQVRGGGPSRRCERSRSATTIRGSDSTGSPCGKRLALLKPPGRSGQARSVQSTQARADSRCPASLERYRKYAGWSASCQGPLIERSRSVSRPGLGSTSLLAGALSAYGAPRGETAPPLARAGRPVIDQATTRPVVPALSLAYEPRRDVPSRRRRAGSSRSRWLRRPALGHLPLGPRRSDCPHATTAAPRSAGQAPLCPCCRTRAGPAAPLRGGLHSPPASRR